MEKWNSFECLDDHAFGLIGPIVFDVRASDKLKFAQCPLCGKQCEMRGWWNADEDGFGSGGDVPRFTILLEKEDDGRWLASVQKLPGVMAYGSTRDEAITKVKSLIRAVILELEKPRQE